MRKLKVLHILNSRTFSGAESVAISIIKCTRNNCDSIYMSPEGNIGKRLKKEGITYFSVKKLSKAVVGRTLKKECPDIIHAHDYTASLIACATMTKIPIISHLHNNADWIKKMGIKSMGYFMATKKIKKILIVSNSIIDEYVFGKLLKKKTVLIGNPIDVECIRNKAGKKAQSEYQIAFIGRLSIEKNPLLFIEIVDELYRKFPKIKACIIGDGKLKEEVINKIKELKLSDTIEMYGFQDNPYTILNKCHILCITSKWEGFGLVAVEALALGVPVVAPPVGGLINIVDSSCGKLCNSKYEFVVEVSKLISDNKYYRSKSDNAFIKANKMDNKNDYIKKIEKVYFSCNK